MKTFFEYIQGNNAESPTLPVGQNPSMQNQSNVTANHEPANENENLENFQNDLQRRIESFLQIVDKNRMNKQKAIETIYYVVNNIANRHGFNNEKQNINTNSERATPMMPERDPLQKPSPPLQPMASG
jgi:hypothetical protein